jgi:ABC-type oligopeptide transport system ATPase subunit
MPDTTQTVVEEAPQAGLPNPPELVKVENLRKYFAVQSGFLANLLNRGQIPTVKAVDGVSFSIYAGEVFGLAGERLGKSTVGRLVLRLLEPTSGKVIFDGTDLASLSGEEMRRLRSRMQIVFQDRWHPQPENDDWSALEHPARPSDQMSPAQRQRVWTSCGR